VRLQVRHQLLSLKRNFPTQASRLVGKKSFEWVGWVHPNELCEIYKIRVTYTKGYYPRVEVLEPRLTPREGAKYIPHMYDQKSLCLFRPRNGHWTSSMLISETIIHWARLWLYYYELWYATGHWNGGGEHLTPEENALAEQRRARFKARPIRTGG
jgi:hypothetical protein